MPPKKIPRKRALSVAKESVSASLKRSRQSPRAAKAAPVPKAGKSKPTRSDSPESSEADDASDYEEHEQEEELSDPEESEEVEIESDSSDGEADASTRKPKQKHSQPQKSGQASSAAASSKLKGKDLLKPGVKTGLGPGTQIVIRKPKARVAGDTPYSNGTIHPNTMLFLADLAANNKREWLQVNDPDFRASLADFTSFIETFSEKIIEIDDTIPELPLKDLVWKIYRDVRFSKDQTPYKTYFSAAWSRTGKKGPFAKFYFQIKPGGCLIAGGLWQPDPPQLLAIRTDIDQRPNRIRRALGDAGVRRDYLEGAINEKKAIEKFCETNKGSALKTRPKITALTSPKQGYDADHRDIELLRLRNFTVHHHLQDNEVVGPTGINRVAELIQSLVPFITYLNSVVMPDEEDDNDDSDEHEDDDDDGDGED